MTATAQTKKKYSYSIKGVRIPEGEWLTMLQAAAYVGMSYARFVTKANRGEIPSYRVPGQKRRRFRKKDLNDWMGSNPS